MRYKITSYDWLIIACIPIIIGATCMIYWPGLSGPFLLDDFSNTLQIRLFNIHWQDILDVAFSNTSGPLGRPVSTLSLALNYYFSDFSEFSYKYTNLMIHLLTGLVLFWLSGRLLSSLEQYPNKLIWITSGLATILWLIHPIQVSTVLYIVQRMAQLSTFFSALAILTYVVCRQNIDQSKFYVTLIMLFACVIFQLVAVLSKENGVLTPLYIIAIEALIFKFKTISKKSKIIIVIFHSSFIILPILAGIIFFIYKLDDFLTSYQFREFSLSERLMTESHVVWHYLKIIFIPRLSEFSLYYDDFPITKNLDLSTLFAIAGIFFLFLLVPIFWKQAPIIALGISLFLISHLIESTIISLELVFEHRNYFGTFGLLLIVSHYLTIKTPKFSFRKKAYISVLAFLLIISFSFLTIIRVDTWSSFQKFVYTTAIYHPNSVRLKLDMIHVAIEQGDREKALSNLESLSKSKPWDPGVAVLKTSFYACLTGQVSDNDISQLTNILRNSPSSGNAVSTITFFGAFLRRNQCPIFKLEWFLDIIDSVLDNPRISFTGIRYHFLIERARTLTMLNRIDEAIKAYEAAYSNNTSNLKPLFEMGYVLLNNNKIDAALEIVNRLRQADAITIRFESYKIDRLENQIINIAKHPPK